MSAGVFVTGRGSVSHFGVGVASLAEGVRRSSTGEQRFREVADFAASSYTPVRTPIVDRAESLALVATALALQEAGWTAGTSDETRAGLALGTAYGSLATLQEYLRAEKASPLRFLHTFMNSPAGLTCQTLRLRGAHAVLCSGPLAGLQAIRYGSHLLRSGKADLMVCGAVDSLRPWDGAEGPRALAGAGPLGEGAGVLVLSRRGLTDGHPVRAKLAGSAVRCSSCAEACFREALSEALARAGGTLDDLAWVVLGTRPGERGGGEERAALGALGVPEARWVDLKSGLGDTGAAQGGLAAVLATSLVTEDGAHSLAAVHGYDRGQCVALVFSNAPAEGNTP